MTITKYGWVETADHAIEITSGGDSLNRSTIAPSDWTVLLKIDASDLVAGHDYTIAASGMIGGAVGASVKDITKSQAVVQVGLFEGSSNLVQTQWANAYHRMPIDHVPPRTKQVGWQGGQGYPFFILEKFTAPSTPKDIYVAAAIQWAWPYKRNQDFILNSFMIDSLNVQVWDETLMTSAYMIEASNLTATNITNSVASLAVLPTMSAGYWVLLWSSWLYGGALHPNARPYDPTALYAIHEGSNLAYPGSRHLEAPGHSWGTSSTYSNLAYKLWRYQFGHCRMLALPASRTWTIDVQGWNVSTTPVAYRTRLVAFNVRPDMMPVIYAAEWPTGFNYVGSNPFYWSEWQGTHIYSEQNISSGYQKRQVFYSVGSKIATFGAQSKSRLSYDIAKKDYIEIDSGKMNDPKLASGNLQAFYAFNVDLSEGDHIFLIRGGLPDEDYNKVKDNTNYTVYYYGDPKDYQLYSFYMTVDDDPPSSSYETAGPDMVIGVNKEAGLVLSSLSALPVEPVWSAVEEHDPEIREMEFPAGYKVTHPKFIKTRRVYNLEWVETTSTLNTLQSFFEGLGGTYGQAFRWTPPGETEEAAWTLDSFSFSRPGSNRISATILELVFIPS